MAKINYRRKVWKIRIPVPKPDRVIEPDTVYDRSKEKDRWKKDVRKYVN